MAPELILFSIGAALSGGSAISQGIAGKQQGDYNAEVAEQNAESIRQSSEYEEGIAQEQFLDLIGEQRSAAVSQGTLASAGSPVLLQKETFRKYLRDRRTRKFNTETLASKQESIGEQEKSRGQAGLFGSLLGATGGAATSAAMFKRIK